MPGDREGVRAAPEQIAAAWRAFRAGRKGMLLGPGPAFVEAINAALAVEKPAGRHALADADGGGGRDG